VEAVLLRNLAAKASEILNAAEIDNVKIRGDRLE
jgi:hypothetical protein